MKNFVRQIGFLLLVLIVAAGCQTDRAEITSQNPETSITANSEMASLITLSAENDGTVDDFIDGLSATSVSFPYVVDFNGQLTTLTSENSLLQFKQTVRASGSFNPISLVFPVEVRSKNHSEKEIRNEAEFENHVRKENDESEDEFRGRINCFRFNFPITLLTFNTNQEQTGSVVVSNKKELFAFFTQLPSSIVVNIQYPIIITFKDETTLQIEGNEQLRRVLLECRNDDKIEDDETIDDDIEGDLLEKALNLQRALLASDWFITNFMNDGEDKTAFYQSLRFEFFRGGAIKVSASDRTAFGKWKIEESDDDDNDGLELELKFRDEVQALEVLDEDWFISEFSSTILKLQENSEGEPGDLVTFESSPKTGGEMVDTSIEVNAFVSALTTGNWTVANLKKDGIDRSSEFSVYSLSFLETGVITATLGTEVQLGTWTLETGFNRIEFKMNFEGNNTIEELDEDWLVNEFSETRISFKHAGDDGNMGEMGGDVMDELVFEKN